MTLQSKVAVITGGARGIGRSCVQAFLDEGAKIAAIDLSWEPGGFSGDRDDEFYRELAARPDDVVMITCDISKPDQVQAAYDAVMNKFGTVDFLFNNAGMRMRNLYPPFGRSVARETTREEWERMFNVTVFGTMDVTKLFIQPMIEQRSGSILSIVSSGVIHNSFGGAYMGLRPDSHEVPYMPAKASVLCAMFYLAAEVLEYNVAVNTLFPGHTRTTGFDEQNAARRLMSSQYVGNTPRAAPVAMVPDHVVPLVKYLSQQDAGSGVTGRCFDTMVWNVEHGEGGRDRWTDHDAASGVEETFQTMSANAK